MPRSSQDLSALRSGSTVDVPQRAGRSPGRAAPPSSWPPQGGHFDTGFLPCGSDAGRAAVTLPPGALGGQASRAEQFDMATIPPNSHSMGPSVSSAATGRAYHLGGQFDTSALPVSSVGGVSGAMPPSQPNQIRSIQSRGAPPPPLDAPHSWPAANPGSQQMMHSSPPRPSSHAVASGSQEAHAFQHSSQLAKSPLQPSRSPSGRCLEVPIEVMSAFSPTPVTASGCMQWTHSVPPTAGLPSSVDRAPLPHERAAPGGRRSGAAQPHSFIPAPPRHFEPVGLPIVSPDQQHKPLPDLEADRLQSAVVSTGLIALLVAVLPPVCIGYTLLTDSSYTFWLGRTYPVQLLSASLGIVVLFVAVSSWLSRGGAREEVDEKALAWTAMAFAALLGALLVMTAIPGARGLHAVAAELAQGQATSLTEGVILMDFMKVLHNIRGTPECSPEQVRSVEQCPGWAENKYTLYLRDLESELECGPLHGSILFSKLKPSREPAALLQAPAHAVQARDSYTGAKTSAAASARSQAIVVGATVVREESPDDDEEVASRVGAGRRHRRHGTERRQRRVGAQSLLEVGEKFNQSIVTPGQHPRDERARGLPRDYLMARSAAVPRAEDSAAFQVGDRVMITRDEAKIQRAFRELPQYEWRDLMPDMLGVSYQVLMKREHDHVGLPSPDGSQHGVWFFPTWVLEKIQYTSLASSPKLFDKGITSVTCFPLIETRLRSYAWSFGDVLFWEGICLIVISLLIGTAPVLAAAAYGPLDLQNRPVLGSKFGQNHPSGTGDGSQIVSHPNGMD